MHIHTAIIIRITMCTCMYYVGAHNPLEISIYTEIDLNSLKIECKHLDKILVSASDIKVDDLLGEGIQNLLQMATMQFLYYIS